MDDLTPACLEHEHDPGLPDRELRDHLLAMAIRQVEAELREHGYTDTTRSLEILHVAIEDAMEPPRVH